MMILPFLHPCTILIAGPSRSGKTVFVRRLLEENGISPQPERIVVIYNDKQPEYEKIKTLFPNTEFIKGPLSPELYESFDPSKRNLLIVDDQMQEATKNSEIEKYFIQGCHHRNMTVVFIVQNLFQKGGSMRTTSLNSNYLVLYKTPRDKTQSGIIGRQMYPRKWRGFQSVFEQATAGPYSCLLVDLLPETPEDYRLRGNVFPSAENPGVDVYTL